MNTLSALSYTELSRLHDDEQYSEDFRMTTPDYLAMCRKKDIVEDKTLKFAKDNMKEAEGLEEAQQIYNETILPNYQEQKEKASELVAKIEENSGSFTR